VFNPFVQMQYDNVMEFAIVDVRDVAEAIYRVATTDGLHGKQYYLSNESWKVSDMSRISYPIGMASECGSPPRDMAQAEDSSEDEAIVCFVKAQRPSVVCWAGNRWLFFDVGSGIPAEAFGTLAWDAYGHLYAGAYYSGLYRSTMPLSYATPDTLVGSSERIVPL